MKIINEKLKQSVYRIQLVKHYELRNRCLLHHVRDMSRSTKMKEMCMGCRYGKRDESRNRRSSRNTKQNINRNWFTELLGF